MTWEFFFQLSELFGNGAAIATAVVAVWAWLRLKGDDRRLTQRLEEYLKRARQQRGIYQHSAIDLSGRLGMTEAQVFQAAVASPNIENALGQDEQGFANRILFQYVFDNAAKDLETDGMDRKT